MRGTGVHHSEKAVNEMSTTVNSPSNITCPTQLLQAANETYAYRRFGGGAAPPLVCLQHFTGTLDNWDPAVTDVLASGREVILFDNAGIGRSTGKVPETISKMAAHALAFLDALDLTRVDLLGFSLGGMVAQELALARPSLVRKMLLVGTGPEGGEDIMRMDSPDLKKIFDSNLPGAQRLVKLFFASSASSQAAGEAFIARLSQRKEDRDPVSGPEVAKAQVASFRAWEAFTGERFAKLRKIGQPCLVASGVFDIMIPVKNSYMLSKKLPNAVLLTYPDSGHGSLFQFHESFTRQVAAFLASDSPFAPY
jgi:pimeloyl-ACP methyl ester carboxylesterase